MSKKEDYIEVGNIKIPTTKVITMEEWAKDNIVSDFTPMSRSDTYTKFYPLLPLKHEDMRFTDEIEDDRINTTVRLSDYDWLTYTYDTRFPTLKVGTLSIRFEYIGATKSYMYVKQFLPICVTNNTVNYVVKYVYEFPSDIFDKYMSKDMHHRFTNITEKNPYAYYNGDLMLSWYNEVLEKGTLLEEDDPNGRFPDEPFAWESVRNISRK